MADQIRVLHMIADLTLGGAEQIIADLAVGADPAQFKTEAVSMFPASGSAVERALEKGGIRVHYLDKRVGLDPRMLPRMDTVIRMFRPHVVHTHCYALLYLLPLILLKRVPAVVHTVHTVAEKDAYGHPRLVRLAFRRGVVPVAVGGEVAQSLERLHGLAEVRVIPNGIQVRQYKPAPGVRERARKELGLDAGHVVFVSVGRLTRQKNHVMLVDCFREVCAQVPEARLLIAGAGEMAAVLQQRLGSAEPAGKARFLGVRDDVPALLAASDVFVLPSTWEGTPLSLMEAMAAECAVICTAVGSVPELVEDGVTGKLVPPGDKESLTRAMLELARDPGTRRDMAAHAGEEAERRFDVSAMIRSYAELYLGLAHGVERTPSR